MTLQSQRNRKFASSVCGVDPCYGKFAEDNDDNFLQVRCYRELKDTAQSDSKLQSLAALKLDLCLDLCLEV